MERCAFKSSKNIQPFTLILIAGIFVSSIVFAFSPPPPDENRMRLCNITGGQSVAISYSPDCGPGCDAAWRTVVYCICPDGTIWKNIEHISGWIGCATNKTGRNSAYVISQEEFEKEVKMKGKLNNAQDITNHARPGNSSSIWFSRLNKGFAIYVLFIVLLAGLIARKGIDNIRP